MSTIDTSFGTSSTAVLANQSRKSATGQSPAISGLEGDSIQLSDEARTMGGGVNSKNKATSLRALSKYMPGSVDTAGGLMAMNMSRKNLASRIDSVIKAAGIKLGKNEKISISVNAKNEITVSGVKDKNKREALEKALNDDAKLGKELRQHVANTKIEEYARQQEQYEKAMAEMGMIGVAEDENANAGDNAGMRALVMESYLQEKAGIGLKDLSLEKGADGAVAIAGANDELRALMDSDSELSGILTSMLDKGETNADFSASFEFANGMISDPGNVSAAKGKIDGVKNKLLSDDPKEPGTLNKFRTKLE